MDNMDKLCKLLDGEIDKIAAKPELNDATLSNLYKLVDVKKDLLEIEEKEMEMDGGMESGNSNRMYPMYARGGNSYRRDGGNSYRYMPRRYYDGGGYSMDNAPMGEDKMFDHLEEAMKYAGNEQEREAIRQVMMKLDK